MKKIIEIITFGASIMLMSSISGANSFYWTVDFNEEPTTEITYNIEKVQKNNHLTEEPLTSINFQNEAVMHAQKYLGVPYVWGGASPKGFDCSGLVQYVFKEQGKILPRTTWEQEKCGTVIPINKAKAGDLYFWGNLKNSYHVAIACGNGRYIHAPTFGQVVQYGETSYFKPDFAIRLN